MLYLDKTNSNELKPWLWKIVWLGGMHDTQKERRQYALPVGMGIKPNKIG